MLKCVKYCLKTENCCLKTQTKHPEFLRLEFYIELELIKIEMLLY